MHHFHLHLITDRKSVRGDLLETMEDALGGGVDWMQVREKTARELYETARKVIPRARQQSGAGE